MERVVVLKSRGPEWLREAVEAQLVAPDLRQEYEGVIRRNAQLERDARMYRAASEDANKRLDEHRELLTEALKRARKPRITLEERDRMLACGVAGFTLGALMSVLIFLTTLWGWWI